MTAITTAANELRREIARHALTPHDIDALFQSGRLSAYLGADTGNERALREEAQRVLVKGAKPGNVRHFERLLVLLDEALDLDLTCRMSFHPLSLAMHYLQRGVAALLMVFTLYMLIAGQQATYPDTWPLRLLGFFALLGVLAVYEGLQISTALLRLKDLYSLRDRYPRAHGLHRLFRTEEGLRKFFAGRQFFVVIVVFFAAQLTAMSTPETLPWIDIPTPQWFERTFGLVFWDLGIAGALCTLWVGQLAPQFLANRVPVRFLEMPGMPLALRAAILLDEIGITTPGTWLANLAGGHESVPPSPREAYREYVEDIHQYGTVGIRKLWRVTPSSTSLEYQMAAVIHRGGLDTLADDGLYLYGSGFLPRFSGVIISADGSERPIEHVANAAERVNGVTQFQQLVTPETGHYLPGDTLVLKTTVEFETNVGEDVVVLDRPTKYVAFRIVLEGEPSEMGEFTVVRSDLDPVLGEYRRVAEHEFQIRRQDGEIVCDFIDFYPPVNAEYTLRWDCSYADVAPQPAATAE